MAKQDVNFRQGGPLTGDSGERGNSAPGIDSIKPYDDGERAVAANFDRPPENLRQRTEVLRGEMEGQKYLQDGDMRWIMTSGKADGLHDPGTEWPEVQVWEERITDPLSRWYFKLRAGVAVVVQPLNTPRVDVQESKTWSFPLAGPFTGSITLYTNRRAYSLANIREVVWQALAPGDIIGTHGFAGFCDLLVSGEDNHILTITINNVGTTMLAHLNMAFLGYAATLSAAGFLGGVDPWSNPATLVTIADIPPAEVDYIFSKTFDRELHYIQSATFDAFFNVESPPGTFPNCLEDGDTLAIMWDYLVNPNPLLTDGRRQAIPANGPVATEVLVGRLFKTSVHPEWIPLGIPLCKRIKDTLVWLDGTVVIANALSGTYFSENGITVNRIMTAPATVPIAMTSMWYGELLPPAWGNVLSALDGIVADLATSTAKSGAERIGIKTFAIAPPASLYWMDIPGPGGACVFDAIAGLIDLTNTKASLAAGGPNFNNTHETITGRWRFNNHVRIGPDKSILRDSPSNTDFKLVYRNNCNTVDPVTEVNNQITWSTYSVYEAVDTETIRLEIWGGYMSDPAVGQHITTPAAGSGIVRYRYSTGGMVTSIYLEGVRAVAAAPLTLDIFDSTDWDWVNAKFYAFGAVIDYDMADGPTFVGYKYWYVNQEVHAEVNFNTDSRIQIASLPWSCVLEGLYMQPEDLSTSDQCGVPGGWNPNKLKLSAGRALVNGKPFVRMNTGIINDLRPLFFPTVTLPGSDAALSPRWYYVWLRSDGKIRIGADFPISDFETSPLAIPGTSLYRVSAAEAASDDGTGNQIDYVLLDVISLMFMTGVDQYYFDCAIPVGGGERRVVYRECPIDSQKVMYLVRPDPLGADPNPIVQAINYKDATAHLRNPGIPVGVSSKAALAYRINALNIDPGDAVTVEIGYNCSRVTWPSNNGLFPYPFPNGSGGTTPCIPYFKKQIQNPNAIDAVPPTGTNTMDWIDWGRLDVTTDYGVGGTCWTYLYGSGASNCTFNVYLLGFYWDRAAGIQSLKT